MSNPTKKTCTPKYTITPCKKGKAKWKANFKLPDGRWLPKRSPHPRKADTERWAAQEMERLLESRGHVDDAEGVTVEAACERWYAIQRKDLDNKRQAIHWICEVWGAETMMADLTAEDVQGLWVALSQPRGPKATARSRKRRPNGIGRRRLKGEGLAAGTIKSYCLKANAMLRFAHKMGWCENQKVELERVSLGDAEWWTVEELCAVLAVADDTRRMAYRLGAQAGLRRGEIVELRPHDLQLDHGRIRIARAFKKKKGKWFVGPPKGGKEATVYIPRELTEELREYIQRHRIGARSLIIQHDGERLHPDDLVSMIQEDAKAAGVYRPGVGTHTLRHTYCSHLALGGASIMAIKTQARHASINTTERYMHLAPADLERSVQYLPSLASANHRNSVETSGGENEKSPSEGA